MPLEDVQDGSVRYRTNVLNCCYIRCWLVTASGTDFKAPGFTPRGFYFAEYVSMCSQCLAKIPPDALRAQARTGSAHRRFKGI